MDEQNFFTMRSRRLAEPADVLTPALEDYLEMIARCIRSQGHVRMGELAQLLGVKPSSVSKMVNRMAEMGLLDYRRYGVIKLTPAGQSLGDYLLWRHEVVLAFFTFVSTEDPESAFVEAELTEHALSPATVHSFDVLLQFFAAHPDLARNYRSFAAKFSLGAGSGKEPR